MKRSKIKSGIERTRNKGQHKGSGMNEVMVRTGNKVLHKRRNKGRHGMDQNKGRHGMDQNKGRHGMDQNKGRHGSTRNKETNGGNHETSAAWREAGIKIGIERLRNKDWHGGDQE